MRNIFIVDDCEFLRMTLSVISTTRSHITMPIMNDFGAIQAIKPIMDVQKAMLSIVENPHFNTLLLISTTIVATIMAIIMIFIRLKAAERPTSVKRIIIPPLMMSTGALMFVFPPFHISWLQVAEALTVGMVCSIFLIKTSKFKVHQHEIYLIPSKAFIFILFGLLAVRVIFKLLIGSTISFGETSGMFFLLAFGMIATWRLAMLYQFLKLSKKIKRQANT